MLYNIYNTIQAWYYMIYDQYIVYTTRRENLGTFITPTWGFLQKL